MRGLRAIRAIFAATTGLDAEQTAPLHLFAAPMREMHSPALRNQIEERLMIVRRRADQMSSRGRDVKSKTENRKSKSIDPLAGLRSEESGSSSIMNCVFPIAPIMCVPVAACHFFDMLSPV